MSTDGLTGVQALERAHPGLPRAPGKVERRESEYIRHGTISSMITRDVVSGLVLAPASGPTRTAADFLAHLQQVVATDPAATRWHVAADNLNIHLSTPLVRYVAALSRVTEDLGEPGKQGAAGLLFDAYRRSDGREHQRGVAQRGQSDEDGTVGVEIPDRMRQMQSQPRLAHPSRPCEREQPHRALGGDAAEQRYHICHLSLAPHQRGGRLGESRARQVGHVYHLAPAARDGGTELGRLRGPKGERSGQAAHRVAVGPPQVPLQIAQAALGQRGQFGQLLLAEPRGMAMPPQQLPE